METLAICTPNFENSKHCLKYFELDISGQNISFAVIKSNTVPSLSKEDVNMVIIKVLAFSCNYRDKSAILKSSDDFTSLDKDKFYYYPFGSDFVAEVISVGENVWDLSVGDRVISDGSYPLKRDGTFGGLPTNCGSQRFQKISYAYLRKIPQNIPIETAAGLTISGQTAYSMVRKLNPKEGQSILITAATSNTSLAVIRLLKNYKVNIYAISNSSQFKDNLKKLGVSHIYEPAEVSKENIAYMSFDAVVDPFYDIYMDKVTPFIVRHQTKLDS